MIKIKSLLCPVCGAIMEATSFEIDTYLSDAIDSTYKVTYKCCGCNTFTTTYTSIKSGKVITRD